MCAKKAAPSPAAKKPAPTAKRKPDSSATNGELPASAASKKTVPVKKAVTATLAKRDRTLSNHDIGAVAGEIWGLLAAKDAQTLSAIKKSVGAPADVVAAAIGWLAREDKLEFVASGKTLKVSLKQ